MSDDPAETYAVGDSFDCPGCGGTHEVRRGAGLSVGGAAAGVDRSPYVRCPEVGVVALPDGQAPPAEAFEGDEERSEWP